MRYEVSLYRKDPDGTLVLLGQSYPNTAAKDCCRRQAKDEHWPPRLEEAPVEKVFHFRPLGFDEIERLARQHGAVDRCPQCGMKNGHHRHNVPKLTWEERLCNGCYEALEAKRSES